MAKTCKYAKLQRYVSYDSGVTWEAMDEYMMGDLIESQSQSCMECEPIYEWRLVADDYICSGTTKYTKLQEYISNDCGNTYSAVTPANYRIGSVIEIGSDDCPPQYRWIATTDTICVYFENKYKLTLSDSSVISRPCDSTSAITSADTTNYTSTLVNFEIGDCVTSIGNDAFYNCSGLTSITIPDSVTSFGTEVFARCRSLSSVTIGSGVTSISRDTFSYCRSLTSITIPDNVTSIGQGAFDNCISLTSITIPDSVTSIGYNAFNNCASLSSCTIGSGVTEIGPQAFYQCRRLSSVTIGSGVTSIGAAAFRICSDLTSITVEATTPPTLGSNVFDTNINFIIYVPSESVDTYKAASGWSNYASKIQAIQ